MSAAAAAALFLLLAVPLAAEAQPVALSANIALQSNQMFRGETISRDDPGATIGVDLDGPGGLFAGAEASVAGGGDAPRLTAHSQFAGLALRTGRVSLEGGVVHRHYRDNVDTDYRNDFVEFFAGVRRGQARLRLFVSPDYLRDSQASYYLDGETRLIAVAGSSLRAHGGLSLIPYPRGSGEGGLRRYLDGSLSLGRRIGGFNVAATVAASNYPVIGASGRARLALMISRGF